MMTLRVNAQSRTRRCGCRVPRAFKPLAKFTGGAFVPFCGVSELPAQRSGDTEIVFVRAHGWFAVEVLVKVKAPIQVFNYLDGKICIRLQSHASRRRQTRKQTESRSNVGRLETKS